ncbi:MAG: bifunctional oligoribonuclease/PAP phosphatase NrnA [Defluviitaleaceae bacterium]|nr:bifunctional oligoribonuclease/PAP phosphatase NrnA [Defluviitaleaceae bacterium]
MTVIEAINAGKNIVIAGHRTPDGDAVGAVCALGMALRNMGKNVHVVLEWYNERFNIIPGRELLYDGDIGKLEPDTLFVLDCGNAERAGEASRLLEKASCTVNIDHHISNTMFADVNHVDSEASSTCEMIFRILREICPIDKDIASALYAGIIYDTGGLRHRSTTVKTMDAVSKLMSLDIPFPRIYDKIMHERTLAEARALGRALENMSLIENGAIAFTYINGGDLADTGAVIADLGGVCEYIVNVSGVQFALFAYQRLDGKGCKVSIRSKSVPVNGIAQQLGGGGHSLAAGCDFDGTIEEARDVIIGMLKELGGL